MFHASNMLDGPEVCEWSDLPNLKSNYYVTADHVIDAFLIMDLGCRVFMTTLELKNAQNKHQE